MTTSLDPGQSVPVHDMRAAWARVDARRARSRQKKIGPSAVGECRRRAAYLIAGTKPTDPEGTKMAALLGTAIHVGGLKALAAEYGAMTEVRLESDLLKGSTDALYLDDGIVEDLKTTGRFAFEWRVQVGPSLGHRYQLHLYAWLLRNGMFGRGTKARLLRRGWTADTVPVHTLRLRYVCRDTGDEWVHEEPYDPDVTVAALAWLAEVYGYVSDDPRGAEAAPRDQDGPGLSVICDSCVFRTACWGPQRDGMMRQAVLVRDDADAEAALADYDRARALAKEAESAKALARAMLTGTPPGQYGDLILRWGAEGTRTSVDMDAVRVLFASAGLEVPMKTTVGTSAIGVSKAKPPKSG